MSSKRVHLVLPTSSLLFRPSNAQPPLGPQSPRSVAQLMFSKLSDRPVTGSFSGKWIADSGLQVSAGAGPDGSQLASQLEQAEPRRAGAAGGPEQEEQERLGGALAARHPRPRDPRQRVPAAPGARGVHHPHPPAEQAQEADQGDPRGHFPPRPISQIARVTSHLGKKL